MRKILLIMALAFVLLGAGAYAPDCSTDVVTVTGTVTDDNGGVAGASVSVVCMENSNTASTVTGDYGAYATALSCPMGGTVNVTATKVGVGSGSNTGDVIFLVSLGDGACGTTINVGIATVDVGIPEFPVVALPALLAMLSFGIARKFV